MNRGNGETGRTPAATVQGIRTTGRLKRAGRQGLTRSLHMALAAGLSAAGILLAPSAAQAQIPPPANTNATARVVEWNCPMSGPEAQTPPVDPSPGGLVTDYNFVWFVTTLGQQRLVRFMPGMYRETSTATCNWWNLWDTALLPDDPNGFPIFSTGGLRIRPWSNQVFIRGTEELVRINTTTNQRTRWPDGLLSFSDLTVRQNGYTYVFTTGHATLGGGTPDVVGSLPLAGDNDVVQRFTPSGNGSGTIKRWEVGGGAGAVFLSGVDVDPANSNLVYFSKPFANSIGRLDMSTNTVVEWSLGSCLVVCEPRQLRVQDYGVWVVTGSGHLVRLNPVNSQMLVAPIPNVGIGDMGTGVGTILNNPSGIDADAAIGFTTAGDIDGYNKVGFVLPEEPVNPMTATRTGPFPVFAESLSVSVPVSNVTQFTGPAKPIVKIAPAWAGTDTSGGTFYEADLSTANVVNNSVCGAPSDPNASPDDPCMPSTRPLGVSNDPKGGLGTYYAAIGGSAFRIAHVSLPTPAGGAVSGCGSVPVTNALGQPAGTAKFSLSVSRKAVGQPVKGSLTYTSPTGNITSLQLTNLTFAGNTATITGLCKPGMSCSMFKLTVTDGGWQSSQDAFRIIRNPDPILGTGLQEGGPLSSGGIKISHQ